MNDSNPMPDDYKRIYQDCQHHPLFQAMLGVVKKSLPYAKERELHLWADDYSFGDGLKTIIKHGLHFELLSDIKTISEAFERFYDNEFGPRLSTRAKEIPLTRGYVVEWNFDDDELTAPEFKLDDGWEWSGSALARAASAYRRRCHWDFAPGEAGIWVCYYLPTDGMGGGDEPDWYYNGNLIGFAILYDRDENGKYESLGHVWTAAAAQRHGVARELVAYARARHPLCKVEGPLTEAGRALLETVWPEVLRAD